jgi:hypothetical protein
LQELGKSLQGSCSPVVVASFRELASAVEAATHDERYKPKEANRSDETRDYRSNHDSPAGHFAFEKFAYNEGEKEQGGDDCGGQQQEPGHAACSHAWKVGFSVTSL